MTVASEPIPEKRPFPRTFYFANAIELLERLSFYGTYIGLSLYLTNVVHFSDRASGALLGNYRFVGSIAPIVCGAIADRITFKRSLVLAFTLYVFGYAALFAFPTPGLTVAALMCMAVAGGFMKPVISGTVIRTSPPGRQVEGFGIFYRMINAGSVVGKTLAYAVRVVVALRYVMITSVIASAGALGIALFAYKEPPQGAAAEKSDLLATLKGYAVALRNLKFAAFLLVASGFYLMSEQFYMTFPKYVTRHIDQKAPLEIITLINPALIALFQGRVVSLFQRLRPLAAMTIGMAIGCVSMLAMGAWPTIAGACLSLALFALAEMCFSPRFYDYIASFAPSGKAGLYMGLAFVPFAVGAWIGGQASGIMIERYMPAAGERSPLLIWSSYAGMGLLCAAAMLVYRQIVRAHASAQSA
jgi:POT family proton-dependent oligopeptide transporter